jgi:hypothetical protein
MSGISNQKYFLIIIYVNLNLFKFMNFDPEYALCLVEFKCLQQNKADWMELLFASLKNKNPFLTSEKLCENHNIVRNPRYSGGISNTVFLLYFSIEYVIFRVR